MIQTGTQPAAISGQKTWEERLVEEAICFTPEIPEKERSGFSSVIFRQLTKRRLFREVRGLNHWQDHAQQRVGRLLRLIAFRRRRDIGFYLEQTMAQALAMAHEASGDLVEAEELVSEANLRLWRGELRKDEYLTWVATHARAKRIFGGDPTEFSDLHSDGPLVEHDC